MRSQSVGRLQVQPGMQCPGRAVDAMVTGRLSVGLWDLGALDTVDPTPARRQLDVHQETRL